MEAPLASRSVPVPDDILLRLERRLCRTQRLAALACLGLVASVGLGVAAPPRAREVEEIEHLRVRRLDVLDDAGVVRLSLGQDPPDAQRRSRAAGLTVHDGTGAERGGFGTFDDGSVVLALDAPPGVGDAMRDRLGLRVAPDGSSHLMLLDNRTRAQVRLHCDGEASGGLQLFRWDMEAKEIHVRTETHDGTERSTRPMGQR